MQRLLNAVTALSVALYVVPPFAPLPAMAQDATPIPSEIPAEILADLPEGAFTLDVDGKAVICMPDKAAAALCPEGLLCVIGKNPANCEKRAVARLADEGAAGATTADGEVAPEAAPEVAPDAVTEVVPEPAPEAVTEVAPEAVPEAVTEVAPEVAPEPAPDAVTEVAPEPAPEAAPEAVTEIAPAPADPAAAADTAAPEPATAEPVAPAATAATQTVEIRGKTVICLPEDKSVTCPDGAICVRVKKMENCEAAATKRLDRLVAAAAEDKAAIKAAKAASDAAAKAAEAAGQDLIDAPKPTEEAVQSLDAVLVAPVAPAAGTDPADPAAVTPPVAAAAVVAEDTKTPENTAPSPEAVVTEQKVTEEETRTSAEEFAAAPATTADGSKKTGLSDLERAGLLALGALAIGQMLYGDNGGSTEVVSNSGDRVVVKDQSGNYQVYKDDDVLLKQPGSTVRTETFSDGSTRTSVMRDDGTSVVTIRDASGRVLRRSSYNAIGIETTLIDDTIPEKTVNVSKLPPVTAAPVDATDKAYLHAFSLRQIRTIAEVKALARPLKVDNVTFETGSAAIRPEQAQNLADLAAAMQALIKKNPNKVFLIEGHTDAVGGAPYNLTLSDRRAESVAKALTEYYRVPPENLVVQGYGEGELLIDTLGAERANRRVLVRDVTPLLRQTMAGN